MTVSRLDIPYDVFPDEGFGEALDELYASVEKYTFRTEHVDLEDLSPEEYDFVMANSDLEPDHEEVDSVLVSEAAEGDHQIYLVPGPESVVVLYRHF